MKKHTKKGFTLIELLMVIAIIGILSGILIPTVGAVKKQANIAASKAQLSNYVTAITMFKGEYGYYPFPDAQSSPPGNINSYGATNDFIVTLSGRNASGAATPVGGNRRTIGFHSFSKSEFLLDDEGDVVIPLTIVDRFDNPNIFVVVDGDGNGEVTVPDPLNGGNKNIKAAVTAYVTADTDSGAPAYYLYDE